jgi:hypothetical protein
LEIVEFARCKCKRDMGKQQFEIRKDTIYMERWELRYKCILGKWAVMILV